MKGDWLMIYTQNTNRAMIIAYNAHNGQEDKSGVPYIFHPIHLAEQMETEEECLVALLHDVIEDTWVTIEQLQAEFSETVVEAVKLLTRDKSVDYMDYIRKIKPNPLARKVKLADLHHNSDPTRMENPTEKDIKRSEKYHKAIEILES
jgi:(p)ppGpp synthase/HD superfamily hydrolase